MKVVILHCHFERGGVTQVVENHVRWLRDCEQVDEIALVSGNRTAGLSDQTMASVKLVTADDFDYDSRADSPSLDSQAESLARRSGQIVQGLERRLAAVGFSRDNSVLHWHNHSLGKNTASPAVIGKLAESGWRLLLQIHDFAEDNRPVDYGRLIVASNATSKTEIDRYLYPVASQIHYATLTRADASVLTQLGVPESQTHCLPNSVVPPSGSTPDKNESLANVRGALNLPSDARWCIYPVRGIRRKNVGEFLLLSRWMSQNQYAGLTLCPATPVERRSYERWKQVAAEVAPRAVFDAGQDSGITFAENMSAADFIVSTSVAEGFGMAFLEPWLVHRDVIARRLPTVTDDFQECGVQLSRLYDAIPVPGDPAWIRHCLAESTDAMNSAWSRLPDAFRPSLDPVIDGAADCMDFARLTPERQAEVLARAACDSGFESALMQLSGNLVRYLTSPPDDRLVRENAKVVSEKYSPKEMGTQLLAIYQELVDAPCDADTQSPSHAGIGVDLISGARPFFPCRTEVLDD